jgi:hypothetical protein
MISNIFELYNELYELICQQNDQAITGMGYEELFEE